MSPAPFDLDAYLARIGHAGSRAPTLDTLRAVHRRHAESITFENLDPFLRRPVSLDPEALQAKLVRGGRGGWCFEQNGLLRLALDSMGFRTTGLAGRVLWNAADGQPRPRTHMLLRVDVDGERWLADVGFGGLTPTEPLRLALGVEQRTPHGTYRLAPLEDDLVLQTRVKDEWRALYRFDLQPQLPADYDMASWYLCNHPASRFLAGLVVARPGDGCWRVLRDDVLHVYHLDGRSEERRLTSADEMRAVLETTFGLALPAGPELATALARVVRGAPLRV